ncbi:hemolysin family protein [Sphingosinicella sp. GR2756]|uniref:Hemolysin family protein n=2 Tax=Sphingosinicella rhizophila TaxID=3050082 RepID=A0ABU3Q8L6_9SPHN|nr:hemolysin family protein [Sphingosinicella sp. GR2756]MDT9599748.1 hemolysin family protein [Sphingosinicella sp. GR2756]
MSQPMPPAPLLTPYPWSDVFIIVCLIALNGVFAMAELAIVSARRPRLKVMAKSGRRGAQTALDLGADPGRFLSTVQIGISLISILAGAYSGSTLGGPTGERLEALGIDAEFAHTLGFSLVIILTTYGSLVIGELVPKQFALRSPEPIAAVMAVPMLWLARATAPLVWLLDRTSAIIFRLLRMRRDKSNKVTAEELHLVVAEAHHAGVLEENERAIISGVVRLADRPTREVMTPRTEVDWIDIDAEPAEVRQALLDTPHSRLPVAEGSVDRLVGVVQSRDIVTAFIEGRPLDLRALMREAPVVPDQMDAMDTLAVLRRADVPIAFVHDEYGHFEGLVTPSDLLAALAGAFASDLDGDTDPPLVERDDGSWWVSGSLSADTLSDRLGITLPEDRDFATAAGFALSVLRHLPEVGERFSYGGWQFEISDMDGRKIDKLLASEIVRKRRGG